MAKSGAPVTLRVDAETREKWEAEAKARGYSLSEFVRSCVDAEMAPSVVAAPAKKAARGRVKDESKPASGMCEHRVALTSYCARCER